MIKYKAQWYDKKSIQISKVFPSSKLCSECGYKKEDLTLTIREWTCPECRAKHDRDINASINILNEAIRMNNECTTGHVGISLCYYRTLVLSKQETVAYNREQESPSETS
ncbi:MAG: transposase [Methanobacteriaceae archaeon]|jgi:transposase|nr:transposase [Methanobacteriaceae archaeon]